MSKIPAFLKKGDTVAIVATAKQFDKAELEKGISVIEKWGLKIQRGKNLYKRSGMFSGTDAQRSSDLQQALDNPSVKAIFCVRGGYGTGRIIDDISFKKFKKSPKWVIGFSDLTILHGELQNLKTPSIHGPMPLSYSKKESRGSVEALRIFLFGQNALSFSTKKNTYNKKGNGKGILAGGNLTLLCSMLDTDSDFSYKNKILFIEEVGESLYRLDRLMVQLKRSGKLKKLSGLIIGQLTDMKNDAPGFGKNAQQIILDAVSEYKYPVAFGFPAGHEKVNMPLIFGKETELRVTAAGGKLIYRN